MIDSSQLSNALQFAKRFIYSGVIRQFWIQISRFRNLWDPSLRSLTWHWNCPLVDCKRVPGGYLNSLIMLVSGLPYRYCEWFIYHDRSTGDVLLNNEWELQINSNPGRIHKWYTTLVVILSIDRVWLFKKYVSNANAMHYICYWYGQRWAPWYKKLYT